MTLYESCREARLRANISLRQAAFEMGYSPATVSRFEQGKIFRLNPDLLHWYSNNTDICDEKGVLYFESKTVS